MSRNIYDNWQRLVEATLKREQLRYLSHCESLSSGGASDTSSRPSDSSDSLREDVAENSAKNMERSFSRSRSRSRRGRGYLDHPQILNIQNYSVFVSTWNVGGKSPHSNMNLDDWLHSAPPADIYVLGFQEIVPLNAGNILIAEDNGPAKKWLALIKRTLNDAPGTSRSTRCHIPSPIPDPIVEWNPDFKESMRQKESTLFQHRSLRTSESWNMANGMSVPQPHLDRQFSVCDRVILSHRQSDFDSRGLNEDYMDYSPSIMLHSAMPSGAYAPSEDAYATSGHSRYSLVASKQMVGIFLTIWIRSEFGKHVRNIEVSCVGRGLMGYLRNKGSVSISMLLHQTSLCFICSHLTYGQKEGDELRRNADVMEILKKTRFPRVNTTNNEKLPETILNHDRIILLGDLNYRIALRHPSAKALIAMQNWRALLEKDQLRIEQRQGRVFDGWKEGKIYFPPTYKYSDNSDRYAGDDMHPTEKRRTPAWCDRILWYGDGLRQLSYVRGESRFSIHRPVSSIFWAEVVSVPDRLTESMSYSSSETEVEELLPYSLGYTGLSFF